MLSTPAPFPYPGSLALLQQDGQTLAVRIMSREGDDGLIGVSVQGRHGATAYQSVPRANLLDATALSDHEAAELIALEQRLLGYAGAGNRDSRRAEALRDRQIRAEQLERLIARLPARDFPAAAKARAELREQAA